MWKNSIYCVIFLENSHRFKDNPTYGKVLGRMRMGTDTLEDRECINTRLIGKKVQLPSVPDVCAMLVLQTRSATLSLQVSSRTMW